MNDDFEMLNSKIPDIGMFMAQRIAARRNCETNVHSTIDPYQLMLKKRSQMNNPQMLDIQMWPEEQVQELQDYCQRMGIVGINSKLNPAALLAMLKSKIGDDYSNVPLEERVPVGYEKLGTKSNTTITSNKRQILHG